MYFTFVIEEPEADNIYTANFSYFESCDFYKFFQSTINNKIKLLSRSSSSM